MSFQDLVGSGSACSSGNSAMKLVDHMNKNKFNVCVYIQISINNTKKITRFILIYLY